MNDRLWFIQYWAKYMEENPEKAGREHAEFLDAMLSYAERNILTPKQYLSIKGEPCKR